MPVIPSLTKSGQHPTRWLGALPDPEQQENNNPEHNVARLEQHRALQRALLSLDDTDRAVIGLRDLQGLSGPEAASLAGLPLNTFKTRLHRARLRLMAALRSGITSRRSRWLAATPLRISAMMA